MTRTFSALDGCALVNPGRLSWAGMNDAFGVANGLSIGRRRVAILVTSLSFSSAGHTLATTRYVDANSANLVAL